MEGLDEIREALQKELHAIPASFMTVWIPIQLSLIALAALLGWALATYLRRRLDLLPSHHGLAGGPAPRHPRGDRQSRRHHLHRHPAAHADRDAARDPARPAPTCIGVAASLATAWVVIAHCGEPDPQRVLQPRGLGRRVVDRGAQHRRVARRGDRGARPDRDRHRRLAGHGAAGDQDRRAARGLALGRGRAEQLPRYAAAHLRGPDAVDPGAARQAGARRARHLCGADRARLGRHRLLGARDLLRRGRRRRRLRIAEDRVEPGQRHHPAGRQVDQAGRRHHASATPSARSTPWARAIRRWSAATAANT